jgi:uncharacterized protein YpmS
MSDGEGLQFLCLILLIVAIVLLVFLCIRLNSVKVEQTKVEQTLVSDEQLDKLLGVITPYLALFDKLDKTMSLYTDCCLLKPLWCFVK